MQINKNWIVIIITIVIIIIIIIIMYAVMYYYQHVHRAVFVIGLTAVDSESK
jgi:hypothetical protein